MSEAGGLSVELPPDLARVYGLVKDLAPLPPDDTEERLRTGRAWLALSADLKKAVGEVEPAAAHVWTANEGGDATAFHAHWNADQGPRRQLLDSAEAADDIGIGTLFVAVLRKLWVSAVIFLLGVLAISLVWAALSGPVAGRALATGQIRGVRAALHALRQAVKRNIGELVVKTVKRAALLLLTLGGGPLGALMYLENRTLSPVTARERTEKVLNETALGREALAYAREHGIDIEYVDLEPGTGGTYSDERNEIKLNTNGSPADQLAQTFVHEVNHARHSGAPDPSNPSQKDYISKAIDEEVDGKVKSFELAAALEQERGTDVQENYGYDAYKAGYDHAVYAEQEARRLRGDPPAAGAELHAIGDLGGRAELKTFLIRNTSYPEQFALQWLLHDG
ncbi:hypothetical protein Misp01_55910 [Microtetraspora sp. NBRC 13810]|nr:hypothetical protein Misp01_55910 [Microtetraspora sp. NBRC 13810]